MYLSAGGEFEKQASDDGAEDLSDPEEDAAEQGKVAADEKAEGDSGVDVAAGDVCADGDGGEEGEGVGNGDDDESGGRVGAEVFDGDGGAGGSEDKDECGDEFGESGSPSVAVNVVLGPTDYEGAERHCPCDEDPTVMYEATDSGEVG